MLILTRRRHQRTLFEIGGRIKAILELNASRPQCVELTLSLLVEGCWVDRHHSLARRESAGFTLGEHDVTVTVFDCENDVARLGIVAPLAVVILREECTVPQEDRPHVRLTE